MYTFPLACQVATNALLVLFYAKVVHRERWHLKRSYFIAFYMVAVLVMTVRVFNVGSSMSVSLKILSADDNSNVGTL
jgi:hypothetical protein